MLMIIPVQIGLGMFLAVLLSSNNMIGKEASACSISFLT